MDLERYHDAMEHVPFDPQLEQRVLARLAAGPSAGQTARPRRAMRTTVLLAAALCLLVLSVGAAVGAAVVGLPVIRDYFGGGGGYEQSAALLDRSVTRDGWSLTLTDCVGDDRYLYLGLTLTTPEGTVLDEESYRFDDYDISFPDDKGLLASWGLGHLPDQDPTDNRLDFMLRARADSGSFNGQAMKLAVRTLQHPGQWNEAKQKWDYVTDCAQTWDFGRMTVSYPDSTIRLTPDLPVTTLDVEATITRVEVSPLSVYVRIEGDALKGHHDWVPENAPDGYYGCIDYQEITLYDKDGNPMSPTGSIAGSGCSGGDDSTEPGQLDLVRAFDPLLDLSTLDHISICGVEIPIEFPAE